MGKFKYCQILADTLSLGHEKQKVKTGVGKPIVSSNLTGTAKIKNNGLAHLIHSAPYSWPQDTRACRQICRPEGTGSSLGTSSLPALPSSDLLNHKP